MDCRMTRKHGGFVSILILIPVGIGAGLAFASRGGDEAGWHFALDPERSWTLEHGEAPVLAAALETGGVAIVPPDRGRVILLGDVDPEEVEGFAASGLSALAAGSGEIWAAAGRALYRFERSGTDVREWHGFDGAGEIVRMARAPGRLWAVHGEQGFAWLSGFDLEAGEDPEFLQRVELASMHVSMHALPDGGVLVQDRLPPYALSKIDTGMSEAWRVVPDPAALEAFASNPGSWTVLSALPLGEGLVVQWYADLRSTARAAVIVNVEEDRVERVRQIDAPLGLIQAFDGGSQVLGVLEVPEGREVMVFRVEFAVDG